MKHQYPRTWHLSVGVRDHQLDPLEAPLDQAAQERRPEGAVLRGPGNFSLLFQCLFLRSLCGCLLFLHFYFAAWIPGGSHCPFSTDSFGQYMRNTI